MDRTEAFSPVDERRANAAPYFPRSRYAVGGAVVGGKRCYGLNLFFTKAQYRGDIWQFLIRIERNQITCTNVRPKSEIFHFFFFFPFSSH